MAEGGPPFTCVRIASWNSHLYYGLCYGVLYLLYSCRYSTCPWKGMHPSMQDFVVAEFPERLFYK